MSRGDDRTENHNHSKALKDGYEVDTTKTDDSTAAGASAAGVRALLSRGVAFYFRTPAKAFFRTRVDYLAYARSISPRDTANGLSWRATAPGLLFHGIRTQGWRFIPYQVLPPLLANTAVGAVLYTTYQRVLGLTHAPSASPTKRTYSPPPPLATFSAGVVAGAVQSVVAAPIDALHTCFQKHEKTPQEAGKDVWTRGRQILRKLSLRAVFAGWPIALVKDSLSAAMFFSTFEYIKAQAYYRFIEVYYASGSLWTESIFDSQQARQKQQELHQLLDASLPHSTKPHFIIEPSFLLLAGVAASIAQQTVIYPLNKLQAHHSSTTPTTAFSRQAPLPSYRHTYQLWKSFASFPVLPSHISTIKPTDNSSYFNPNVTFNSNPAFKSRLRFRFISTIKFLRWLYRGFWLHSIRQTPATSAGLIVFELVRRKYGIED